MAQSQHPRSFATWPNLATVAATFDTPPWDWQVTEDQIAEVRQMPKPKRREWISKPDTQWNTYSATLGENWYHQASRENPPAVLLGFVADYDVVLDQSFVFAACEQRLKLKGWCPSFLETSLSGRVHGVWLFERPVLVRGLDFADTFLERVGAVIEADNFLPGFERSSYKSTMRWTNGGYWTELSYGRKIPATVTTGIAMKLAAETAHRKCDVPLEQVSRELAKRYPRFSEFHNGHLRPGLVGVRFWDEKADNPNGAQVIDRGFYCLTGEKAVVRWEDLIEKSVVEEMRLSNYGQASEGFYFDGRQYYTKAGSSFNCVDRTDMLLRLSSHGFSRTRGKDEIMSPAEGVLNYIQTEKLVDGAAPLLFHPPGINFYQHRQLLNTARDMLMRPHSDLSTATPDHFPWMWHFYNVFFAPAPGRSPLDHYLCWFRRFYKGALEQRPVNGQALFLCGPRECGKNFISELLLPLAFGGSAPNPYKFLMGETDFSDDILEAAILAINDEDAPPEQKRTIFEQKVKAMVANNEHAYHPKFMKKVRISWRGRLIVTLNDGPKDVGMLPMLNTNTADKMCFFRAQRNDHQFFDVYKNREIAQREMPHFLRWLVDVYVPPAGIEIQSRMGVESYHDPYLVKINRQEQTSYNLLELLAAWMATPKWQNGRASWAGTPTDLLRAMSGDETLEHLLKEWTPNRLSKALGDLARTGTPGVKSDAEHKSRSYTLVREQIVATVTGAPIPVEESEQEIMEEVGA